jgi:hypothetical protein
VDTEPPSRADIRGYEEVLGLRLRVVILSTRRRIEPQRDPAVAVVVDYIRGKGLAAYAKIREAV